MEDLLLFNRQNLSWEQQPPFLFWVQDYRFTFTIDAVERKIMKITSLRKTNGSDIFYAVLYSWKNYSYSLAHSMVLSNKVILFEALRYMKGVCRSGGRLVSMSWGLELRSVGRICRVNLSRRKRVSAIKTVCLETEAEGPPLKVAGMSSVKVFRRGCRTAIWWKCYCLVFGENVLEGARIKIPCHFKSLWVALKGCVCLCV